MLSPFTVETSEKGSVDMSLDSEEESVIDPRSEQLTFPEIQLSFGTGKNGAWDDRELVDAYDTAMEEFHLLNPGPGSWLDKATAAMAIGRSFPGATAKDSAWYYASLPTPPADHSSHDAPANPPHESGPPTKRLRREKATPSGQSNPYRANTIFINEQDSVPRTGVPSPVYAPPSPPSINTHFVPPESYDGSTWAASNGHKNGLANNTTGDDLTSSQLNPMLSSQAHSAGVFPQPTSTWGSLTSVSANDALSYAMNAQYWAGYWMGLARASIPAEGSAVASDSVVLPQANSRPAHNVLVTKRHFGLPGASGRIKR